QFDMVRLGIGLYGVGSSQSGPALKEVSALRSVITQIKPIREGETIGYGRAGLLPGQGRIATVPIGYADGYPRLLSEGRGKVLVNGHLAPVVGKVCMDMTMIDITSIPGVKEGDPVLLFGPGLPVADLANWANTIPYEILTGISERVKRIYYEE
ncbi:MAG TPA: alanine racemase C-terminal domain-containing protein, partial [Chitinophagaceae bacterium]|nr:alanine racemase C-terminal domain-containing protein [Chitinophagaceae bacterium]